MVTVELLLKKCGPGDVSSQDAYRYTPLHCAAQNGNESVVTKLLGKGAGINLQDALERTPLLIATEYGHQRVVQLLLNRGANVDLKDIYQKTALHYVESGTGRLDQQGKSKAWGTAEIENMRKIFRRHIADKNIPDKGPSSKAARGEKDDGNGGKGKGIGKGKGRAD